MTIRLASLAALAAVTALAGCASLDSVDNEVSSYSRWPSGRAPASYAFERLPSQQAAPQQSQMLEDAARRAIESAGFAPAADPGSADVTVQLGARIVETDRSPFDDPFWYGGYGAWHRPFAYSRYGRPFWGPGGRGRWGGYGGGGYGWGGYDFPYYEREVAVLIRDKRTGQPLYESRAQTEGSVSGAATVLPAMFTAALKDFPLGAPTNPHRVVVQSTP